MKYEIKTTKKFDKNLEKCKRRNLNIELLWEVVGILESGKSLPAKYKTHKLKGEYKDCWECHIQPDWLLVWQQKDKELILILTNTGTHSDLF
ncbi:MAG: type II toxin-antitoxin system YafQ family toxin [Bacteroidetes bacterium]|nr:type II toxin-antitoxin system YafQ family toxin [Bacteroidota bacterium]